MLPIRLGVVTAVAALCLWTLFSLLDSLQKPELLRSRKAVVVKGCDTLDSDDARRECPALLCEKALIDAKQLMLTARFSVELDVSHEGVRSIAGSASSDNEPVRYFVCELRNNKVAMAEAIEKSALDELKDE